MHTSLIHFILVHTLIISSCRVNLQLLMGYIGLVVLVPCLPFAAYMIYNVRDNFTWSILGCIVLKGLLDFVLTDYFLFRSVVLTSATTATVGLGLTIPMAFVADLIFSPDYVISLYSVIGAVSVGAGFISVSLSGDDNEAKQEGQENEKNIEPSVSNHDGALATDFVVLPGFTSNTINCEPEHLSRQKALNVTGSISSGGYE